ncbi:phage portal protein [Vibrio cholerae]|nr:phage portal protein [Vibrio cholerae]
MSWLGRIQRRLFGGSPTYDGVGGGRRALAWQVGNPGAVAALAYSQDELRAKSRDLVRRNAWAAAGVEAFVSNAIGTGIKPQSMVQDQSLREGIHRLWSDWCEQADAAGLTDFYGLQALACRAMLEGGECLVRLRFRKSEDGLPVGLQLQVLEPEHLPVSMNTQTPSGNLIRAGIEFDRLGRRVAYHLTRTHPGDGAWHPCPVTDGPVLAVWTRFAFLLLKSSTYFARFVPARFVANPGLHEHSSNSMNWTNTTMPSWFARKRLRCLRASLHGFPLKTT